MATSIQRSVITAMRTITPDAAAAIHCFTRMTPTTWTDTTIAVNAIMTKLIVTGVSTIMVISLSLSCMAIPVYFQRILTRS